MRTAAYIAATIIVIMMSITCYTTNNQNNKYVSSDQSRHREVALKLNEAIELGAMPPVLISKITPGKQSERSYHFKTVDIPPKEPPLGPLWGHKFEPMYEGNLSELRVGKKIKFKLDASVTGGQIERFLNTPKTEELEAIDFMIAVPVD